MQEDWDDAIAFVLKMEGGETAENNPDDPGGLTKFGISQKAYPSLDIANLTVDDAKEIYRRDFWVPCLCDDLPRALAISVFDTAVNMGTHRARRILQIALGVTVDGMIGPLTLAAAAKSTVIDVAQYLLQRMLAYSQIIYDNKSLAVFATNWSHRVLSMADIVLKEPNV